MESRWAIFLTQSGGWAGWSVRFLGRRATRSVAECTAAQGVAVLPKEEATPQRDAGALPDLRSAGIPRATLWDAPFQGVANNAAM